MDLKALFDSLYDKLVLRDLFGKVVPGIAFILSLVAGLLGLDVLEHVLAKMTALLWIVTVGFAWLLGFALQYLGEILHVLRTHPRGLDGCENRDSFYAKWAAFQDVAKSHEMIHAERLNVIKEACGNAAVSIACALAFAFVGAWHRGTSLLPLGPFLVVGSALAFTFWRMHIIHVERYGRFLENTLAFRKKTVAGGQDAGHGT